MFQITLRMAREMNGYKEKDVAEYLGITTEEIKIMENYEIDIPIVILNKIRKLYGIPFDVLKVS